MSRLSGQPLRDIILYTYWKKILKGEAILNVQIGQFLYKTDEYCFSLPGRLNFTSLHLQFDKVKGDKHNWHLMTTTTLNSNLKRLPRNRLSGGLRFEKVLFFWKTMGDLLELIMSWHNNIAKSRYKCIIPVLYKALKRLDIAYTIYLCY